ncbi:hypothetical protein ACFLXE_00055 [Chloroflexota bacterium]
MRAKVKSRARKHWVYLGEYRGNSVERQVIERIERQETRDQLRAVLRAEVEKDAGMSEWTIMRLAALAGMKTGDVQYAFRSLGLAVR